MIIFPQHELAAQRCLLPENLAVARLKGISHPKPWRATPAGVGLETLEQLREGRGCTGSCVGTQGGAE